MGGRERPRVYTPRELYNCLLFSMQERGDRPPGGTAAVVDRKPWEEKRSGPVRRDGLNNRRGMR